MPQNRLQDMTIKQMQLGTPQFAPVEFKAPTQNWGLLANSYQQLEERQNKAAEQQTAIDVSLGKIESELHDDAATKAWFQDYKNNIKNQIQNQVDTGNYGSAIRLATRLAGDVANDEEVQGRLKTQQQWKEADKTQENRMLNGKISKSTLNWWRENGGQYKYKPITDAEGNIIGSEDFQANSPVDDIDYATLAHKAFTLISADRRSKSTSTSKSSYKNGTGSSSSSSSESSMEKVTREDILANIRNILDSTPDGYRAVEQSYQVYKYETQQKKQEIDNIRLQLQNPDLSPQERSNLEGQIKEAEAQYAKRRQMVTAPNGQPYGDSTADYEQFFTNMIEENMFAEGLAYERTSTGSSSSKASQVTTPTGGGSGGNSYSGLRVGYRSDGSYGYVDERGNRPTVQGPPVQFSGVGLTLDSDTKIVYDLFAH